MNRHERRKLKAMTRIDRKLDKQFQQGVAMQQRQQPAGQRLPSITIQLMPNGTVNVSGPLMDVGLCYMLLELGKDAVREYRPTNVTQIGGGPIDPNEPPPPPMPGVNGIPEEETPIQIASPELAAQLLQRPQ